MYIKYTKTIIIALLMASSSAFAETDRSQLELATVALDGADASYVVVTRGSTGVDIITYAFKDAGETCKFLIKKGIDVKTVENYNTDATTGRVNSTMNEC